MSAQYLDFIQYNMNILGLEYSLSKTVHYFLNLQKKSTHKQNNSHNWKVLDYSSTIITQQIVRQS